jgi:hypothetical protein
MEVVYNTSGPYAGSVTGTPDLLYNNTGTAPAGRSDGMGALVWMLVFSVGGAVSGYLRVEELHIKIRHMAYLEDGVLKGWDLELMNIKVMFIFHVVSCFLPRTYAAHPLIMLSSQLSHPHLKYSHCNDSPTIEHILLSPSCFLATLVCIFRYFQTLLLLLV